MKIQVKKQKPGSRAGQGLNHAWGLRWHALWVLTFAGLLCGCPQLKEWRDNQIQTSHNLAASAQPVQPPAQPVQLPSDIEAAIPLDPAFTVLVYSQIGDVHNASLLSVWGTQQTIEWLLSEMTARGYSLTDNPSRILEGVDFENAQAKYRTINIKVEENSAQQTLITFIFTES